MFPLHVQHGKVRVIEEGLCEGRRFHLGRISLSTSRGATSGPAGTTLKCPDVTIGMRIRVGPQIWAAIRESGNCVLLERVSPPRRGRPITADDVITAICETHRSDSDLLFSPNILIYPDAHLAAAVLVISVGDTNVGLGMHWDSHRWCGCPEATSVFGSVFQAAPLHRSLIDHPLVAPASAARALSMLL